MIIEACIMIILYNIYIFAFQNAQRGPMERTVTVCVENVPSEKRVTELQANVRVDVWQAGWEISVKNVNYITHHS